MVIYKAHQSLSLMPCQFSLAVNGMLLQHLINPALPAEQLTMLEEMAQACPYDKGNAVYKARALMQDIAPGSFYDDLALCNAVGIYKTSAGGRNHYAQENQLLFSNFRTHDLVLPNHSTIRII
jgi:hypothetical protein